VSGPRPVRRAASDRGAASVAQARDQAADARDQAGDERDHVGDERDQAGDDRDHAGDDRDDAGDVRDHAGDQRDHAGDERDFAADERDQFADARDHFADARDQAAEERDLAGERRDEAAEQRDKAAEHSERAGRDASTRESLGPLALARRAAAFDRGRARLDRRAGAKERTQAECDREAAFADRGTGASERTRAEHDRETALADREAGASERVHAEHDRTVASADREAGASERVHAEHDRSAALDDRGASAWEREYASVDDLTGVYRRGPGFVELGREIARARRTEGPLLVAFIDIDGLKAINDTHGHAAGDRMLRQVADAMKTTLRSYDLIIRYGGDEFVCVMPGQNMSEAHQRLTSVNTALADAPESGAITFGIAELQPDDTPEDLVARADAAFYRESTQDRRAGARPHLQATALPRPAVKPGRPVDSAATATTATAPAAEPHNR
jgi:diguanylate cyclase (GGDEF)-like protein